MPTTARRFYGLCIGGPVAGQFKASDRPEFVVVPMPDYSAAMFESAIAPMEVTVSSVRYKFVDGLRWRDEARFEDDSLNFWIPSDQNWSPLECVRQMAEDYANYHDLRNS